MTTYKYNIEKWLVVSIPFFAIFSIFFLEVLLIYLTGAFIYYSFKNSEIKKYFKNKIFYFFSIFYFYILLRYLFVEKEYLDSTISIIFYFRYGLYFTAIFYFLKKIPNLESLFLKTVVIIFIVLFFDALFQFTTGYNIVGYEILFNNRVSSFFEDELILGSYLLRFSPFLFIFLISNIENKIYYNISFFLITVLVGIIFITGERSATVLILLLLIYYFIFLQNLKRFKVFSILISVFIIFVSITFSSTIKNRFLDKTLEELNLEQKNPNITEVFPIDKLDMNFYVISSTHTNYLYTSMNMFKDNIFFGKGPKTYRYYCKDEKFKINRFSCSTHPHNYYAQILAELGLVGILFFLSVVIFILINSFKLLFINNKQRNYTICYFGFYIINLWPLTTTGNFFNNWLSILMYLPIGFYLYRFDK